MPQEHAVGSTLGPRLRSARTVGKAGASLQNPQGKRAVEAQALQTREREGD